MGFREGDSSLIISRNVCKEPIYNTVEDAVKNATPAPPSPPHPQHQLKVQGKLIPRLFSPSLQRELRTRVGSR